MKNVGESVGENFGENVGENVGKNEGMDGISYLEVSASKVRWMPMWQQSMR